MKRFGFEKVVACSGSIEQFDRNWIDRPEASYNHWVRGRPANQIQLAFRRHWELFSELLHEKRSGRCLEVGCGRGSISSYFADNGFDCSLLDSSRSVLETAETIFMHNGHHASFVHGDALCLPFEPNSFDVVVSIGLLEHFDDAKKAIREQIRVLKPDGLFLGYIVPHRPRNIQRYFRWLNLGLKAVAYACNRGGAEAGCAKVPVFRSDHGSGRYLTAIEGQPVRDVGVMGMYPLPMISHSPEFPFSLLPGPAELFLTRIFEAVLSTRELITGKNPWVCSEQLGQAFLLTFRKAEA